MTTLDLTNRLLPLPASELRRLASKLPRRKGSPSGIQAYVGGGWYIHPGDLVLNGDYDHTLNLLVDGNLTVQGTLDDSTAAASLVVLGDLRCEHLLSRYFLCVTGSLRSGGLVFADYNDHPFEIWGPDLSTRMLVISDRSCVLPETRILEAAFDSDEGEVPADFETAREMLRNGDESLLPAGIAPGAVVALRNPGCPAEVTAAALEDPRLHLDLALSPAATAEHLAGLAESSDTAMLVAIASHPRTPRATVQTLAKSRNAAARAAVAHHPLLTEQEARKLASDRNADVRRQAAASRHAAVMIDGFVNDKDAGVRRAITSHPDLTDLHRRALLADHERAVVRRALTYLPKTQAWVDELAESGNELLAAWAIENRPKPVLRAGGWRERAQDLLDPRRAIREASLRQIPKTADLFRFLDERRDTFAEDESPMLRTALAAVTRDAAMLDRLSQDGDPCVRRSALANFAVPEEVLLRETARLCEVQEPDWDRIHELLSLPHLPAAALSRIDAVYPRRWLLEAHRNMPLAMILSRAETDWGAGDGDPADVFARMLDSGQPYFERAARCNGFTPVPALLRHAREFNDASGLAAIASNAALQARTRAANDLIELLLTREESGILLALAANPDLSQRVLREAADRDSSVTERARLTIWQVYGERL